MSGDSVDGHIQMGAWEQMGTLAGGLLWGNANFSISASWHAWTCVRDSYSRRKSSACGAGRMPVRTQLQSNEKFWWLSTVCRAMPLRVKELRGASWQWKIRRPPASSLLPWPCGKPFQYSPIVPSQLAGVWLLGCESVAGGDCRACPMGSQMHAWYGGHSFLKHNHLLIRPMWGTWSVNSREI